MGKGLVRNNTNMFLRLFRIKGIHFGGDVYERTIIKKRVQTFTPN
jgi:hypothetical protein